MIIGRKREQELLENIFNEKRNRFVTVYGRRRVGKTYLINEFFKKKDCLYFHVTGKRNGKLKDQLENFTNVLSKTFFDGIPLKTPSRWKDALILLTTQLEKTDKKIILFFDELPWLATQRSGLLDEISYFWNKEWLNMKNLVFVACGSSASWMIKNIIYDKGGLHNRTNLEINLQPFDLALTKVYLHERGIKLTDKHILSLYMAIGGIPYYLDYISGKLTAQQNIQLLFFDKNAPLKGEFNKLFESLFNYADAYKELLEKIAEKPEGISLPKLGDESNLSSIGGLLTERLQKLCDTGFIEKVIPWKQKVGAYYKVIDEYCLFYLRWVKNAPANSSMPDYWTQESNTPKYYAWSGYAFEGICSKHILQIFRALKITHAHSMGSWRYKPQGKNENGAQIDLVFDRNDDAITLCEIKYTDQPFIIDKRYAALLNNKLAVFKKQTKTKKQIFLAMISANGLTKTMYSEEMISGLVTLEDLFKSYGLS